MYMCIMCIMHITVYIYIYIYIYTHVYIYIYIHTYTYIYIYIHIALPVQTSDCGVYLPLVRALDPGRRVSCLRERVVHLGRVYMYWV